MTLGRMMDITYRLNVGLLNLILDKMRGFVDPVAWVSSFLILHLIVDMTKVRNT